jgi:cysteine desulfurase
MAALYLDFNATTPIDAEVLEAMLPYLKEEYGNPSSGHPLGKRCHRAVERAREQVASLIGASAEEIVFTSCGTEANNLAVKGSCPVAKPGHLVVSAFEHPAVALPAQYLQTHGWALTVVPADRDGRVEPSGVLDALRPDTRLVSIMHSNNEIGTLQPIASIAGHVRSRGILLHTDAAQGIGKVPVRVDELDVDMLSIAGHKLYAPKGIGALYVRRGVSIEPLLHGAGHERGLRAGTENVPYVVGLGQAAEIAARTVADLAPRMRAIRDRLWERLRSAIGPPISFNGHPLDRLPNTLSVNFPWVSGPEILGKLPWLCASTGAACHSGSTELSATLRAIGLPAEVGRGTVRLSIGRSTTQADVDRAAEGLASAWRELAGRT